MYCLLYLILLAELHTMIMIKIIMLYSVILYLAMNLVKKLFVVIIL